MSLSETLKKIYTILDKPGMFAIESVDDISLIITWEIHMNGNEEVSAFFAEFTKYLEKDSNEFLHGFSWCKIIRLYSGSNSHSLQLFRKHLDAFIPLWQIK